MSSSYTLELCVSVLTLFVRSNVSKTLSKIIVYYYLEHGGYFSRSKLTLELPLRSSIFVLRSTSDASFTNYTEFVRFVPLLSFTVRTSTYTTKSVSDFYHAQKFVTVRAFIMSCRPTDGRSFLVFCTRHTLVATVSFSTLPKFRTLLRSNTPVHFHTKKPPSSFSVVPFRVYEHAAGG